MLCVSVCICVCVCVSVRAEEMSREMRVGNGLAAVLSCVRVPDNDVRRFALRSLCNLAMNRTHATV